MSGVKDILSSIKSNADHMEDIYIQAISDKNEWVDKYYHLFEQYEAFKLNIERKQAEKCQACRQGTK